MAEIRKYLKDAHVTVLARKDEKSLDLYVMPGRVLKSQPAPADLILSTSPDNAKVLLALLRDLESS